MRLEGRLQADAEMHTRSMLVCVCESAVRGRQEDGRLPAMGWPDSTRRQ